MKTAAGSPGGEMRIMDASGHQQLKWHMGNHDEIDAARATFDRLLRQGYAAFGAATSTEAKHAIKTFDPAMKEMVMVPRIVGG